ncbi:MAG TPA: hypothetical protein VIV34_11965 [Pseudolabrys sp.]
MATSTRIAPVTGEMATTIQWSAVIAGAIAASALAFVLHAFAGAIGLSIASTAPTWRDSSFALVLLSGLYLILLALASYGFGAFIAARLGAPMAAVAEEREFFDGLNGLIVWALATLLTGLFVLAAIQVTPRLAAPSAASSGLSSSVAGENLIAYDLDRLFRSERRPQGPQADMGYLRGEAARILLTASSHRGMPAEDRTYLTRLVAATTGLAAADAERRVNEVIARASDNISRARHTAVILGFMVGAAALIGAIAAWYAAGAGGRQRDGREMLHPLWDWGRPVSRL